MKTKRHSVRGRQVDLKRRQFLISSLVSSLAVPSASVIVSCGVAAPATGTEANRDMKDSAETNAMSVLKYVAAARDDNEAWEIIRQERNRFIWTDDEEPEAAWNGIAEQFGLTARMKVEWTDDDRPMFLCGDDSHTASLVHDRDDSFIVMHALAMAGMRSLELRFCRASAHSSDQAYAVAPRQQWVLLDNGPLSEGSKRQFLRLPRDVKALARLLYAPHPPPEWAAP